MGLGERKRKICEVVKKRAELRRKRKRNKTKRKKKGRSGRGWEGKWRHRGSGVKNKSS